MAPTDILTKEQRDRINMSFRDVMIEYKYSLPDETSPNPKIHLDSFSNFFADFGAQIKKSGDRIISRTEIFGEWVQNKFHMILGIILVLVCLFIILRLLKCICGCISSTFKRSTKHQNKGKDKKENFNTEEQIMLENTPQKSLLCC